MKAGEIYRELMNCPGWSTKRSALRWLAARYYAGVDSLEQLRAMTRPIPCHGYHSLLPILTESEVSEIIALR